MNKIMSIIKSVIFLLVALTALSACGPQNLQISAVDIGCSVDELIQAIDSANNNSVGINVINLDPDCIYNIKAINNKGVSGHNGLPIIYTRIEINGNGATIQRDFGEGTTDFRFTFVDKKGNLTLRDLTLTNGLASTPAHFGMATDSGGALVNFGVLKLDRTVITKNNAWFAGGAILNYGELEVTDSTISSNEILEFYLYGKGAAIYNGGTAKIERSAITDNGYIVGDAAIFTFEHMIIRNTTISGNERGVEHEAEYLAILHSTLAYQVGYGVLVFSGSVVLQNSILAQNLTGNCVFSLGNNLNVGWINVVSDLSCNTGTLATMEAINLAPLGDYGGPTNTHALLNPSVAFDTSLGTCPDTDQRGEPRPAGPACDVGAFEGLLPPDTAANQSQPSETPTATEMPTNTATNTATSTSTASPSPTPASREPQFDTGVFYHGGGCVPQAVTVNFLVIAPDIFNVVLFFRLEDTDSGQKTEWTAVSMNLLGDDIYTRTVPSDQIQDANMYTSAYFQVQIVVTRTDGSEIMRTDATFDQLLLLACGEEPPAPTIVGSPTATTIPTPTLIPPPP